MHVELFDLHKTMESGQCFNYIRLSDNDYIVMANGMVCEAIWGPTSNELEIVSDNQEYWKYYFAIDEDYAGINSYLKDIATLNKDSFALASIAAGQGIRILRQPLFETCCEFIISQQNNIPRIRKIIFNISEKYSKPVIFDSLCIPQNKFYPFPSYNELISATVQDFKDLGLGYRAEYLYSLIQNWPRIEKALYNCSSGEQVFDVLTSCKGIGKKVANCIMLFGIGCLNAFPIDVWMGRVIKEEYEDKGKQLILPDKYAGILQQYMFWNKRKKER